MSGLKKGLGRGFDSLIPTDFLDETFDSTAEQDGNVSELATLPLSEIHANADQPRRTFDEDALGELARSIREHGVLQPIIVVKDGSSYQIVAGERRFRASQKAGLERIPVIIRTMTAQNQLEVSLIENIQRRDLNAIETATAYAKLRDQFNMTNEQIASRVHKSISAVMNTMRLLKLPKDVLLAVADGQVTEGQVRPLIGQPDELVLEVLPRIISEHWSARKVEQYVVHLKDSAKQATASPQPMARRDDVAEALAARIGAKVSVQTNAKGAGKIVISFSSSEELERLKNVLGE